MRTQSIKHFALTLALVLGVLVNVGGAQDEAPWADSIKTTTTPGFAEKGESSLQDYLDQLGYDIDVANDELGSALFCGVTGLNTATMVIEVAGSAVYSTSGYYAAGDTSVFYQLFGPSDGPGDSVQFNFAPGDYFGCYMKPNLPGNNHTWLTETSLNSDNFDHAWVFATGQPHEYLVCFEDLPNGGDADYQDLVIRLTFSNQTPQLTLPDDTAIVSCDFAEICFDVSAADGVCEGDSIWVDMLEGEGSFSTLVGFGSASGSHCFTPAVGGLYRFVFQAEDQYGAIDVDTVEFDIQAGSAPIVTINDSSVALCEGDEICVPVDIIDADCDVISVTSNLGAYSGTLAGYDQVSRINKLGGTITQIGGGAPGTVLYQASDFVAPINSQSGVAVALPNFAFADHIVDYGSFPNGSEPGNSADHLLNAPTDLTFTTAGAGGPDGGAGDGSVAFASNDRCVIGFPQEITTCNGANVDFVVFTNTNGGGDAQLRFRLDGTTVHTITRQLPGGTASSGTGGVTFDLPDGITFNEVRIRCTSGNLEIDAFAARTAPSSTTEDICFWADTTGVYEVTVTATDGCGNETSATAYVTVNLNEAPVTDAGNDQSFFHCSLEQVCLPVSFSDPDGNLAVTELHSGPGTLNSGIICFTPPSAGAYTFVIRAEDDCGLEDYDTLIVSIDDNDPPVAGTPSPVTVFQCVPTEICRTLTASDPNGGTLTWTLLSGVGTVTAGGEFCYTPTASGSFTAMAAVADSCGAADTVSLSFDITLNTAPVAVDAAGPVDVSQCAPAEICHQFTASDAEGGTLVWARTAGTGTLSTDGRWCFTPTVSGTYTAEVTVTDSCGLSDVTSMTFNVVVNEAPAVAFGPDTVLTLCVPEQVCVGYTVNDPQGFGGITEEMLSGFGAIDTAANEVCFTPTADGSYEFVVRVTDNCGATARDTIVVDVTFGEFASISCPSQPINVSLCSVDSVCQLVNITPAGATVTVSQGTYANGELCFYAAASGTYDITVIAEALCSTDTCVVSFNVEIGEAAQIDCPAATELFLCDIDSVCIPVGVVGSGATVTVSPIGNYEAGNLCFLADTAGHYEIEMIASTTCGTDTCLVVADIEINSNPVAVNPTSPVDTFLCDPAQVCYQFGASDIDGGSLVWNRVSGNGTVTANGLWCFDANADGDYTVVVAVTDSCGAADTTSLTYNVGVNTAPVFAFGNDTTIFQCVPEQVCLGFTMTDAEDNIEDIVLLEGDGTIFTSNNYLCFHPTGEGTIQFVGQVTDACGEVVTDTILVTIEYNAPPTVFAGNDQTVFQCVPAEICWATTASDPDGNLATVELVNGPGSFDGTSICFTPTGTLGYEFVLKATDACGAEAFDTVVVDYTLNSAPVADAGADQTLFLCEPTPVCWPASCSDVDGNLAGCALVSGPGAYDGTNICFTPGATGIYTFVLEASDACGETHEDTVVIDVTINTAPVCSVPDDTTIFQCVPQEVCLPVSGDDVDGNFDHCQIISGQGALVAGNWCYTPVASQTVVVGIKCLDACGAECVSQFTVQFEINEAPTIAFGADVDTFLCESTEICLPYTVGDENDPRTRTVTLESGPGTLDEANSQVCFTAPADGDYEFVIKVEDECGEFATDTVAVSVMHNSPPAAFVGNDLSLFVCSADTTICWPASCTDPDDNLTDCLFNGPGTYDGSQVCFSPATSGDYLFTLRAVDACGEEMVDSVVVNITLNSAPEIAFGADSSLHLCQSQEVCVAYTVDDADGPTGLVESMVSGYGTINTATNSICFTPTTAGSYEFVVSVTDPCGAMDEDTIVVDITFGQYASINCPTGPLDISLCAVETVCQGITVAPVDADVTVSYGTFSNGELCFLADTSGVYTIEVIAAADCGSDTCEFVFNVDIGSAAEIDCPAAMDEFLCSPDDICFPIGVMGTDITVSVSPIGNYTRGNVCFTADTTGHYELTIIADTPCGSDTCVAVIDVTINSAPVAVEPAVVDTFLCVGSQICYQFEASDADSDDLTWNRVSGNGSITAGGLWCFDANTVGTYTVSARATDPCGADDIVTATYNVTINTRPVVTLGADTLYFQCASEEVCIPYEVVDADDNVSLIEALPTEFAAGLDTDNSQVCFTPTVAGPNTIIVQATDECGEIDADTIVVAVMFNHAPVADAGEDVSLFQCNAAQVCLPASCTDVDGNLDSCYETTGSGTYDGSNICFTPTATGVYTFVLRTVDVCGEADEDTVVATITINSAPSCQLPAALTTFFQCAPEQVSLPVTATDVDENFDHCEIVSGPGSVVGGNWIYTPSANETATVAIMCLDECGASCVDSFQVRFTLNNAPIADAGNDTTFFLCGSGQICWEAGTSDVDGNLESSEILAPAGAVFNEVDGTVCFTAAFGDGTDRSYTVILQATDSCGVADVDSALVRVNFNAPPTVAGPPDFTAYLEAVGELCFGVAIEDEDDNLNSIAVSPIGIFNEATGQVCFNADTTGTYCFEILATDNCGAAARDSVCIEVQIDECIHVQIEKTHQALQGHHEMVNVYLTGAGRELGGYDFLIAYDPTALTPSGVLEGDLLTACGWEYFSFRYGPDGNCGGCPSGLIRIVAMAEMNDGASHPGCFLDGMTGTLATIDFLVTNDRTLECMYIPVEFFWNDCGDNTFSSRGGDTLWVSRRVYDFESNDITNITHGFPGRNGAPDLCLAGDQEGKPVPLRCVDFTNGGVDIICAEEIDDRGDMNLNGVAYEIADAVMYTNYFLEGLGAFEHVEGAIAASEVNGDGVPLTVADLVYLLRVVVGDAPPMPKIVPGEEPEVLFTVAGGVLSITETPAPVGALYIVLEGDARPTSGTSAAGMDMRYKYDGTDTKVLIFSMKGKAFAELGAVLDINGTNAVKSVEIGGYDGSVFVSRLQNLPDQFELSQNYPNPFNPTTVIEYALPVASKWNLTVFNVLGQTVETWSGEDEPGYYKIEWDANRYASGVYLYRLSAGGFSSTRKMVLLK